MAPDSSVVAIKAHWADETTRRLTATEETVRRVVILTTLYLIPALYILHPVIFDPDVWWHLRTGKWVVEQGMLPTTDPFSIYGEGHPWIAYSWLFEVGLYGLVRAFGEGAVLVYTLLGVWVIILLLHRMISRRCSYFALTCGLLAVSTLAMSRLFTPRPWLLSIIFFTITLEVVLLLREGKRSRWFWLLPIVYMTWANMHVQFIYGLGLLCLACAAPLIDRCTKSLHDVSPPLASGAGQWKPVVALTVLCTMATLLTPHHVHLYTTVVQLSAQTGMWEYALEMQAPAFRTAADWAMLVLFALALARLGWRRSWSSFEIVLLAVAGASAFRGARDTWFLVLAAIVVVVSKEPGETKSYPTTVPRSGIAAVIALVIVGVVCITEYRDLSPQKIRENTAEIYPIEAASFVEQQAYEGPLYNDFDWGGYLIWRLPQLKVSMDGRANVHGDERIKRAIATWAGGPHWSEDPDLSNARLIIAKNDMALASLLRLDRTFTEVYRDETAVVFVRAVPEYSQPKLPETPAEIASVY